jgi:putative endonuclease
LVERNLAKVDVAGSSPVSRSNPDRVGIIFFGGVAKWSKAKVCKTFIRRFESDRRLKSFLPSSLIMYYTYVLHSLRDQKRYIGSTDSLIRRVDEHNNGLVKSTKNRRPLVLIYSEEFHSKTEALKREKFFKSGYGRSFLKKIGK